MVRFFTVPLIAAALTLSACASIFTPKTCADLLSGADTVDAIAKVLIDRGIEAERARVLADWVLVGRIGVTAACTVPATEVNALPLEAPAGEAPQTLSIEKFNTL